MNLEALISANNPTTQRSSVNTEKIDRDRELKTSAPEELGSAEASKDKVQSEELINQIKAITEDGLYSVQFESNDENTTIVKVIDRETQEVIRQIPPEDLLELSKHLNELRGNLVDTEA